MNEQQVSRAEFDELRRRMDAAEERLHNGDITLALLREKLNNIDSKLEEMANALQDLRMKPARRWDSITSQVLQWALAILLGYVAVKIGLTN